MITVCPFGKILFDLLFFFVWFSFLLLPRPLGELTFWHRYPDISFGAYLKWTSNGEVSDFHKVRASIQERLLLDAPFENKKHCFFENLLNLLKKVVVVLKKKQKQNHLVAKSKLRFFRSKQFPKPRTATFLDPGNPWKNGFERNTCSSNPLSISRTIPFGDSPACFGLHSIHESVQESTSKSFLLWSDLPWPLPWTSYSSSRFCLHVVCSSAWGLSGNESKRRNLARFLCARFLWSAWKFACRYSYPGKLAVDCISEVLLLLEMYWTICCILPSNWPSWVFCCCLPPAVANHGTQFFVFHERIFASQISLPSPKKCLKELAWNISGSFQSICGGSCSSK